MSTDMTPQQAADIAKHYLESDTGLRPRLFEAALRVLIDHARATPSTSRSNPPHCGTKVGPLAVVGAIYDNTDWYTERRVRLIDSSGRCEVLTQGPGYAATIKVKLWDGRLHPRWKRVDQ
jgi:hypothetical protein